MGFAWNRKTSIAITVGRSLQSQGSPVCFISLRRVYSKNHLISAFFSVFRKLNINGQPFEQGVSRDDKLRQMVSLISNWSVFILDHADHLLDGRSPKVKNFANSRGSVPCNHEGASWVSGHPFCRPTRIQNRTTWWALCLISSLLITSRYNGCRLHANRSNLWASSFSLAISVFFNTCKFHSALPIFRWRLDVLGGG